MSVAEESRSAVPEDKIAEVLVTVGAFTDRKIAAAALVAFSADNRERYDHPITLLKLLIFLSDLDHLAHELVAHDVTRAHAWHEAIKKVEIRPADSTTGDFNDCITPLFDLRVGNGIAANVMLAVVTKRLHHKLHALIAQLPKCGSVPDTSAKLS
jgi:hypothetical protein